MNLIVIAISAAAGILFGIIMVKNPELAKKVSNPKQETFLSRLFKKKADESTVSEVTDDEK